MDGELRHPLRVLRGRDRGVDVEVADEVDDEEGDDEADRDDDVRGSRQSPREKRSTAKRRGTRGEHVGEADLAGDVPVHLSNVTEKMVARKRKRVIRDVARSSVGELLDSRTPVEALAELGRERCAVERAGAPAARGDRRAPPRSRRRRRARRRRRRRSRGSGRRPRRRAARRRGSAARRRGTRTPSRRARPCRGRPPPGSAAAAPRSRAGARATRRRGTYGSSSSRSPRPSASAHSRSAGAEVADEARDDVRRARLGERGQERLRVALAEEVAGVRDAEPVARVVLEAREVVEVAAVRDRHDLALRLERARLLGDRVGGGDDRVGLRATSRPTPHGLSPSARRAATRRAGAGADERVAQVGDPRRAARALDRGAEQMQRRGGEVVMTTSIPSRRARRIATGIA